MSEAPRRPKAIRLDDPTVTVAQAHPELAAAPAPAGQTLVVPEAEPPAGAAAEAGVARVMPRRRWSWGGVFAGAVAALVSLSVGLAIDGLIRELFGRADWLGWVGLVLLGLAVVAALVLVTREAMGLARLRRVDRIRADGAAAGNDPAAAKQVTEAVLALYADVAETARGRAEMAAHMGSIVDGRDLLVLAERDLIGPLDRRAVALVMEAARNVSVVTAISPRAVVDLAVVVLVNLRLIRRLAELYGGRPGTLGFVRLARAVLGHLAITGGMAIGDTLVQQLVGQGLAARLSAKLGEGVVNGFLTARVGLAAIELTRPLPFLKLAAPSLGEMMSELARLPGREREEVLR